MAGVYQEYLFERCTESARQVVVHAQEEARDHNLDYIGGEHLLLGLLGEEESFGAVALNHLGVKLEEARDRVLDIVPAGEERHHGQLALTPHAIKALRLSVFEAVSLGSTYVGTEHELLGLIEDAKPSPYNVSRAKTGYAMSTLKGRTFPDDMASVAGEVLTSFSVDLDETYDKVKRFFAGDKSLLPELIGREA